MSFFAEPQVLIPIAILGSSSSLICTQETLLHDVNRNSLVNPGLHDYLSSIPKLFTGVREPYGG